MVPGMRTYYLFNLYPPREPTHLLSLLMANFVLVLVGIISAILTFMFLLVGDFLRRARYVVATTGIVASVLLIIAPIYLFADLPEAFNADSIANNGNLGPVVTGFFGQTSFTSGGVSIDLTYGGGLGWFVCIVSSVLLLAGTILGTFGIHPLAGRQPMSHPAMQPAADNRRR